MYKRQDTNIIDRSGAESLIPIQESNEIIQGTIAQSAVLSRGRKLANMTSKQYKMPVLDMLPIAYFVNGDNGQKKTTKQAWDKKFITAEEIAVIVPIPEAVLLSLIHISEPTRRTPISYAVFCLKKKKHI